MIPGQLIAPGQLTDLRVNFASVPVTVHISFLLPQSDFERWVNPLCRGNFSPFEQNAKFTPGQE